MNGAVFALAENRVYKDNIKRLHVDINDKEILIEEKGFEWGKMNEEVTSIKVMLSRTEVKSFYH